MTLNLALRGVLPAYSGAAGVATSAVGQLGSSVGAALFNTIAATVVAGYLWAHPGGSVLAGTVHGFDVAMAWGGGRDGGRGHPGRPVGQRSRSGPAAR